METKNWLDLTMYGVRLFLNLDQTKVNHTLVVSGRKVASYQAQLEYLGFERDLRFAREYWVRPLKGITPRQIHAMFPESVMRETPITVVMPALAVAGAKVSKAKMEANNGPELTDARNLSGYAHRGQRAASDSETPVLVEHGVPNSLSRESEVSDATGSGRTPDELPATAAGTSIEGSEGARERVAGEESVDSGQRLHGAGELDEPRETVGAGDTDFGVDAQLSGHGDDGTQELTGAAQEAQPQETQAQPQETQESPTWGHDADEAVVEVIDRKWRGISYATLAAAQQRGGQSFSFAKTLAELEAGEDVGPERYGNLANFMGWGGIAGQLSVNNGRDSKNFQGLNVARNLSLSAESFSNVLRENRLESYYTPAPIAAAVWSILERAGIDPHSRILEPGCGIGGFFACAPDDVKRHARMVGVECDPIAQRIAKFTIPDVTLIKQRYEQAVLERNFDVVIGNVPFGETKVFDRAYPKASHIHDYFIVRSLDQLKAGGLMAVITSRGTLDKKDDAVRQQIMERADLIGAIRLPEYAFESQGASVITDILLLQRRPDGTKPSFDFTKTQSITLSDDDKEESFEINGYFVDHPEMVLGEYAIGSSAFGAKLALKYSDPNSYSAATKINGLAQRVLEAAQLLPQGIAQRTEWEADNGTLHKADAQTVEAGQETIDEYAGFIGDLTVVDGKIVTVVDRIHSFNDDGVRTGFSYVIEDAGVNETDSLLLADYIRLRDATRQLVNAQLNGSDDQLALAQEAASSAYSTFVEAWGSPNATKTLRKFEDDPGATEVCALEFWDEDKQEVTALSDVFTKRVVHAARVERIESASDAYYYSIDQTGKPDFALMSKISGLTEAQLKSELVNSLVFVNPKTGLYERADNYLSGNVVEKLFEARQAAELNPDYLPNVNALTEAQPVRVPADEIFISLGATWIPTEEIVNFVADKLGARLGPADFTVRHEPISGSWSVHASQAFKTRFEVQRKTLMGTQNASFEVLLEKLLNKEKPTHTYKDEEGKTRTDEAATMASREKQDEIASEFRRWVTLTPERAEYFCDLYNNKVNAIQPPKADGARITFPGLASSWKPRKHQMDMVAMAMLGHNVMAAHAVGAGKTFEMVAIAMKLKQIGMASKPMIAVPNHMLGQISREAKQMYPGARILMVTADDLRGANRKKFLAIARNNDWDIVVCTHSMLNGIEAPLNVQTEYMIRKIAMLNAQAGNADDKRLERRLAAKVKSLESELADLVNGYEERLKAGAVLSLDMLGVDCLHVDEAHLYKNLELGSGMNVLGVTTGGSKRAMNIEMLGEYLRQHHGKSFGMFFYTGTPVSNSMCELFVHNRILRPELLESVGINHFDDWAANFGDVVTSLDALPEGGGFKVSERFARFVNLPELLVLFRSFADVKTKEQLNLPRPKVHTEAISVEQSEWQKAFMKHLAIRATAVRKGKVDPSVDNILSIATAGRKAALDIRLCDPILPNDSSYKLKTVAEQLVALWKEHADVKATQLVFMDMGTPGKGRDFTAYDELKRLLTEQGIPANEIAFVHDAKNNDAKEELFKQVRAGDKRILIGSTEKMGVGTNVQERLVALHQVDCPWRPADIEQRKGRIDRQGNLFFKEVKEFIYTTKDSFDLFMWQTVSRKKDFIEQVLADPRNADRSVSEEVDVDYSQIMAITTGNPKILEKVEVDEKVKTLTRKQGAWESDRLQKLSAEYHVKKDIEMLSRRLASEKKLYEMLPKASFKSVTVHGSVNEIQDGSTTWLYATQIGEALKNRILQAQASLMSHNDELTPLKASIGDIELYLVRGEASGSGLFAASPFYIAGFDAQGQKVGGLTAELSTNTQVMGQRLRGFFDVSARIKEYEKEIADKQRGLAALGDLSALRDATSPYERELTEAKGLKKELDTWFAMQDFSSDYGLDPYLMMLAEYRTTIASADSLEEVEDILERPCVEDELALFGEAVGVERLIAASVEPEPVSKPRAAPSL